MSNIVDENFTEEVWFVYGFELGPFLIGYLDHENRGECCSVTFDPVKAFFGSNKKGKKANQNLIGFYHSHPCGDPYLSTTDKETMDAWVKAMGKPLICGVFSDGEQECFFVRRIERNKSRTVCNFIPSKILKIGNKKIFIGKKEF